MPEIMAQVFSRHLTPREKASGSLKEWRKKSFRGGEVLARISVYWRLTKTATLNDQQNCISLHKFKRSADAAADSRSVHKTQGRFQHHHVPVCRIAASCPVHLLPPAPPLSS